MAATIEAPSAEAEQEAREALQQDGRDLPDGAADDAPGGDVDPQTAMFDQVIEDESLEQALEAREKKRAAAAKVNAEFKERKEVVKAKLDALDLEDGTVARCGRFRIKVTRTEAKSVSFETAPSRRTTISLLDG